MGPACCIPPGLKCPPAEEASGAEQSPFSWRWIPCVPGVAFSMCTSIRTPPRERSVNVAQPDTFDPLRGSIVARACAPAAPAGAAAEGVEDVDLQPAVKRKAAATSAESAARVRVLVVFI